MKLYATTASERGKPVSKSSNECIRITLTQDRRNKFDIIFDGDKLEVMRYYDATIETIKYIPQYKQCTHYYDNYGKCTICGNWKPMI